MFSHTNARPFSLLPGPMLVPSVCCRCILTAALQIGLELPRGCLLWWLPSEQGYKHPARPAAHPGPAFPNSCLGPSPKLQCEVLQPLTRHPHPSAVATSRLPLGVNLRYLLSLGLFQEHILTLVSGMSAGPGSQTGPPPLRVRALVTALRRYLCWALGGRWPACPR